MIVAAAGNVEHEDFVAHVRDAFWRMIGESPPKRYIPPPVHQEGATVGKMPVSQAYFALGLPCFPFTHSGRYMVHILNKILGGGLSSRLYRLLREEHGLVYQIATEYHAYGQAGMLVVEGSTAPDYLQKVLALTLNALARISADEKPICEEELWKAKMQIHGQHLLESEHSHTRMSRLATQELYFSQHFSTDDILAEIESLTLDRMRPFSRQFFTEALPLATLAVIGPDAHNQVDQTVLDAWLHDFKTSPKKML